MIYRLTVQARFLVQVAVLHLSWLLHGLRGRRPGDAEWVVGPYEIAGIVHDLALAVPGAQSVILARHPFYAHGYDWMPGTRRFPGADTLRQWFQAPWVFGRYARRARGFVYVSGEGFLHAAKDHRDYEFRFLARRGLKIVCYFTGNDIRSPRLMRQLESETGRPNIGTYLGEVNRVFESDGYELAKRGLAQAANRYADAVFNADLDQRGYLERESHPFRYFQPDDEITDDLSRFDDVTRPVVVHAPSAPILKGSPLVRAAIARLRDEGYDFDYVELVRVPHSEVRAALLRAHIVLNEFYAYVPGVFAVEAMAAGAAVLTSADERLDPQLPAGSNDAWMPTEHHRIAENLRTLLDDPERARSYAAAGIRWVRDNAAFSVSGAEVARVLDEVLGRDA